MKVTVDKRVYLVLNDVRNISNSELNKVTKHNLRAISPLLVYCNHKNVTLSTK